MPAHQQHKGRQPATHPPAHRPATPTRFFFFSSIYLFLLLAYYFFSIFPLPVRLGSRPLPVSSLFFPHSALSSCPPWSLGCTAFTSSQLAPRHAASTADAAGLERRRDALTCHRRLAAGSAEPVDTVAKPHRHR
ncbi:hypothetical protein CDD83_761 [Cordyceps sp. RAO-2017]|nr:hypothetical protein CDD83_761 [Cordyceps sp. RAO-2017]